MLSLLVGAFISMLGEWLTPPDEAGWLSEGAFLVAVVAMTLVALVGLIATLKVQQSR